MLDGPYQRQRRLDIGPIETKATTYFPPGVEGRQDVVTATPALVSAEKPSPLLEAEPAFLNDSKACIHLDPKVLQPITRVRVQSGASKERALWGKMQVLQIPPLLRGESTRTLELSRNVRFPANNKYFDQKSRQCFLACENIRFLSPPTKSAREFRRSSSQTSGKIFRIFSKRLLTKSRCRATRQQTNDDRIYRNIQVRCLNYRKSGRSRFDECRSGSGKSRQAR